ncbi:MAG: four helix bundle protein [Deltaproteobacteria bacterium]|nr:four helix bundle protein [Deltaproteobacteria bacterium]
MNEGENNSKHEPKRGGQRTDPSDQSDRTDRSGKPARLRPSGGYRKLRSFQAATVIYDATVSFCNRLMDPRSRTVDQMIQAARSGRQNIAEGSRASAASSQTELRLVNVARASLDELLLDFEDFLRQHGLPQWAKDDPQAQAVRAVGKDHRTDRSDPTDQTDQNPYSPWLAHADPAVVANAVICLIHQANYLLDRQVAGLERQFIQEGGYSERLAAARIAERQRKDRTDRSDPTDRSDKTLPACPACGKPMALRTARKGPQAGSQFWGCSGYPGCKGTKKLDGSV